MRKRFVMIVAAGAAAFALALGPAVAANAWASVVVPGKPADCAGSWASGSSWYTATTAQASVYSPGPCLFYYTLGVTLRQSGGGSSGWNTCLTQGIGCTYRGVIANTYSANGLPFYGGIHQFGGGTANS